MGKFSSGDLLLTCDNLPHDRVTEQHQHQSEDAKVVVLHLQPHFWQHFPEFQSLAPLLTQARYGVWFPSPSAELQHMIATLSQHDGLYGLAKVLEIFAHLARCQDRQTLSSVAFGDGQFAVPENKRVHRINEYLLNNYQGKITQQQVASMVAMSPQAFSRWFKQIMNCTFITHLNKIRIEKACLNLLNPHMSVSQVSAESGFDSLSLFNRQFMRLKSCTPKQFRQQFSRRT